MPAALSVSQRYDASAQTAVAAAAWQEPTKYITGVLLLLSGMVILLIGRSAIPLVIMAALLALFLQPAVRFLMARLHFPRGLAVAVPYLLVVLALVLAIIVIVPSALNALSRLAGLDFNRLMGDWAGRVENARATVAQNPVLSTTLAPFLDELGKALERALEARLEPPAADALLGSWAMRLAGALARSRGSAARWSGPDAKSDWFSP